MTQKQQYQTIRVNYILNGNNSGLMIIQQRQTAQNSIRDSMPTAINNIRLQSVFTQCRFRSDEALSYKKSSGWMP